MNAWGSPKAPSRAASQSPEGPHASGADGSRCGWTMLVRIRALVIFRGVCGQGIYTPRFPFPPSSLLTLNKAKSDSEYTAPIF
jgi:hypothetical protein